MWVRSIRSVGDWTGAALHISEKRPPKARTPPSSSRPGGRIVGAFQSARGLIAFGSCPPVVVLDADDVILAR